MAKYKNISRKNVKWNSDYTKFLFNCELLAALSTTVYDLITPVDSGDSETDWIHILTIYFLVFQTYHIC